MIKPNLKNQGKDYAIVAGDFIDARATVAGSRALGTRGFSKKSGKKRQQSKKYNIKLTFAPYINLYEALCDGLDEVEVVITDREKFTLNYFNPIQTPASVVNDINSFFTKSKQALYREQEKLEIYSEEFNLTDFVRDSHVALIGKRAINKTNYSNYLPTRDIVTVANFRDVKAVSGNPIDIITTSEVHTGSLNDERDARDLAFDSFDVSGYDPAMIGQVRYPADSKLARSNGTLSVRINPPRQTIPQFGDQRAKAPAVFYELHKKFFKSTATESTQYSLVEKPEKIKHQRVKFNLRFQVKEDTYQKLVLSRKLFILLKYKKNNVTIKTEKFSFNSQKEFEKGKAVYKALDLRCKAGDPTIAESDKITLTNRNNFSMKFSIIETSIRSGEIHSEIIKRGLITKRSTLNFNKISTIFGSSSQSRSYRVMSSRIGGTTLCNIDEVVTPSSTLRASYDSHLPVIHAIKAEDNSAIISVKNPPSDADLIKIIRKDLGSKRCSSSPRGPAGAAETTVGKSMGVGSSRGFVVAMLQNARSFFDYKTLFHNSTYEYKAEFYSNGAKLPVGVSTVLHYMNDSSISSKISFKIGDKSSGKSGNSIIHKFVIEEAISKDTAEKLLSTINTQGQQSTYSSELAQIKNRTGTITKYNITRTNTKTGKEEIVSTNTPPNVIQTFEITSRKRDTYKYTIKLSATEASKVSYSSAVEKIDQLSGQTYKFSNRKWRGQKTYDDEALPSQSSIIQNNFSDALNDSGQFASVTFSGPMVSPKIQAFSAGRDPFNKCNWLEWSVSGEIEEIDHFLILCFYNGIQAPIGAAGVPTDTKKKFIYKETRMYGLLGTVTYQVIIVSKDFTYYTNSPERSVTRLSTVPLSTLMKRKG